MNTKPKTTQQQFFNGRKIGRGALSSFSSPCFDYGQGTSADFAQEWLSQSQNRLGLRCIHCKDSRVHVTAAAFFTRTIGSIASGLGTIGTRHFGWGKCPFVNPELVQDMVEAKKTSSSETRARGKMGLDAYCRDLASRYDLQ